MTNEKSVDEWLLGYERRDKKCIYIGGAVAALLVVGGLGDKLFGSVDPLYRASFITTALVSGALIGVCKIIYEQAATELAEKKAKHRVNGSDELDRHAPTLAYPKLGPFLFVGGLAVLVASAMILVAAVVAAVVDPIQPEKCALEWSMKDHKILCTQTDN
jgi:hypothetical protein